MKQIEFSAVFFFFFASSSLLRVRIIFAIFRGLSSYVFIIIITVVTHRVLENSSHTHTHTHMKSEYDLFNNFHLLLVPLSGFDEIIESIRQCGNSYEIDKTVQWFCFDEYPWLLFR